jgi:hypothetical protein
VPPRPIWPVASELVHTRARLRCHYQGSVGRRRRPRESAAQITPMPSASRAARSDGSPRAAARPCSHACPCRGRFSSTTGVSRSDTTLSAPRHTPIPLNYRRAQEMLAAIEALSGAGRIADPGASCTSTLGYWPRSRRRHVGSRRQRSPPSGRTRWSSRAHCSDRRTSRPPSASGASSAGSTG